MRFGKLPRIGTVIALLVLISGFLLARSYLAGIRPSIKKIQAKSEATSSILIEVEETICPFCGLKLKEGELFKPVAVMFDNHLSALPHAGISNACLVIETLAEGGVTRIQGFYAHDKPERVGPVRSARLYFVDFALSYDALLAHCGGSPEALSFLRKVRISIDQIRYSEPYYRDRKRRAPHNLYGRFDGFFSLAKRLGYDLKVPEEAFFLFVENPPFSTQTATQITVPFTSKQYSVSWKYDPSNGTYRRFTTRGMYIDEITGKAPDIETLIVLKTKMKVKDAKGRLEMNLSGKGSAWFFFKGRVVKGFWQKSPGKPFSFLDANGNPVEMPPGKIWIEILPENLTPLFSN